MVKKRKDHEIYGAEENIPHAREEKIRETCIRAKNAFYQGQQEQRCTYFEFMFTQSKYIKKGWWAGQFALLFVLWIVIYLEGNSRYIKSFMGVLIPVFVIMMMPELWKNRRCQSTEIENAAYFSLRQVYSARMTIFAMVDLVLLSAFLTVMSITVKISVWDMIVNLAIPFNVTCCICFTILFSKRFGSEYLAVALCLVWAFAWWKIILWEGVYTAISQPVWIGLLVMSTVYLVFSVWKVLKNSSEDCEVNVSWS